MLVARPEALRIAEAPFVLVTPLSPASERRYFTLEIGWDVVNRRPYTVLGEWADRGYLNLGIGPAAEPEKFIEAVAAVVAR